MSVLQVSNRQRVRALDRRCLLRLAKCLLEDLLGRRQYELGVHVIAAAEMTRLNAAFLGHEGSTDVITFNHDEGAGVGRPLRGRRFDVITFSHDEGAAAGRLHGEIFICMDEALVHARRFRVRWQWEVARYLVHGLLHLEGCDDVEPTLRRAMKRRENKLLKELSLRLDLGKLGRECH